MTLLQSPAQDGPPLVRIANAETVKYTVSKWVVKIISTTLCFVTLLSDSEIQLDTQKIVEQTGVVVTNTERRLTGKNVQQSAWL